MSALKKLIKTAEELDRPAGEKGNWLTVIIEILVFGVAVIVMACIGIVAALLGAQGVTKD